MSAPKILVIPGSHRASSINAQLGATIVRQLEKDGASATLVSLADYPMPIYDGDWEEENGAPEGAKKLAALMSEHQGVVFVCPEYNASITPLLKNTLDWLSRDVGCKPYAGRAFALASCSPGALGGIRGLSHMRDVFINVGADAIPAQLCVGPAGSAFDDDGNLTNERQISLLQNMSAKLIERAKQFS
ncbi:NADPH-dependent FMN reductase [Pseudahrensia aquimaris]|uniref:NADPH-dependent FMN reductase n=1 Tax=Pseudahrensia aquimaris TaxID=744461 RepID=A0ABW3FH38_9HYPH